MSSRVKGFTLIELLIVVAIIAILAAIAVPNFLEAQTRSKVARVKADQRSLATALESYYIDNNSYPAQDSSYSPDHHGANQRSNASAELRLLPTLRIKSDVNDNLFTITTPVTYVTSYFSDPFADSKGATFSYSVSGMFKEGWIIWSFGPDTDEKVNPNAAGGDLKIAYEEGDQIGWPLPRVETFYYLPATETPSETLRDVTYDPTNGTTSDGDVYRFKT